MLTKVEAVDLLHRTLGHVNVQRSKDALILNMLIDVLTYCGWPEHYLVKETPVFSNFINIEFS